MLASVGGFLLVAAIGLGNLFVYTPRHLIQYLQGLALRCCLSDVAKDIRVKSLKLEEEFLKSFAEKE